jgi:hypothetical protein
MIELNLVNKAPSQSTLNFNSMCKFNGEYLGASSTGVYKMVGYNDNGVQIPSIVKSGMNDFGSHSQKRFRFFYFGVETTGDLILKVFADGSIVGEEYSTSPLAQEVRTIRVPISRKGQARYWSWSVENVDGSFFSLYSVKALPVILHPGHN